MRARTSILAVLALSLVLGASAVADALVVTDAEALDRVADALVREEEGARVDAFLAYADPLREPMLLRTEDGASEFGEGQEIELASSVRDALAAIDHGDVSVVQRAIEVDGENGTVAARLRTPEGLLDVRASLRRLGDGWLVLRLDVRS
jgi:hypothetical protein